VTAARQEKIRFLLQKHGHLTVAELAEEFKVSEMTIRRDLKQLSSMGLVIREHGKAIYPQNIKNVVNNFTRKKMECHTLSIISRMDSDIIEDEKFDIEDYLIKHFAKSFGKAEENAFINGTGIKMPTGILNNTDGAEIGATTTELTFDNVISLYFSVKPEYRTKGSWLMNDEVAKTLYTLKDADGNYLWNHNTNTIMGRPVYITNAMPSTGKIIAFGDFSYYWVVTRKPISARAINELFIANQQIGYLASEYFDGKLIRTEAIKVLQLN